MTRREYRKSIPLAYLRRWSIGRERQLFAQIAAMGRRHMRAVAAIHRSGS